jgi:2-polyprenyl-6-methoxyphenol hydroxylase-like FAD-dependent oxidoreductase
LVLTKPDFDVAIIGGGPAGSSMGAYLAKAGVNCVVLERELFPRPHVGESLVPSAMRVFRDLDFINQMEEARFPHKFGAAWTAEDRGAERKASLAQTAGRHDRGRIQAGSQRLSRAQTTKEQGGTIGYY